jgi:hypothetical protein
MPKDYCPIKFTVWTPDNDSMLDYVWTPLPKRVHTPLRVRVHRAGLRIVREDIAYLRARCAELGALIKAEQSLLQFQEEFQALEAKVLREMGL